jgi:hypothetical protein
MGMYVSNYHLRFSCCNGVVVEHADIPNDSKLHQEAPRVACKVATQSFRGLLGGFADNERELDRFFSSVLWIGLFAADGAVWIDAIFVVSADALQWIMRYEGLSLLHYGTAI